MTILDVRWTGLILLTLGLLGGCGGGSSVSSDNSASANSSSNNSSNSSSNNSSSQNSSPPAQAPTPSVPSQARISDVRNYIFGHSLINHEYRSLNPGRTNMMVFLTGMAEQAGHSYAFSGRYGFFNQHAASLPPTPNWAVDDTNPAWPDSGDSFSSVNFNTVLYTDANFRQGYAPTDPDPNIDAPSSVESTLAVFDWVANTNPEQMTYFIYENWREMNSITRLPDSHKFPIDGPPTETQMNQYYEAHELDGEFHQWWLEYYRALSAARPNLDIKLIPVGPIIINMLQTNTTLSSLSPSDIFEDTGPHGRPALYFLASMITYMSVYGEQPPSDYNVPSDVHQSIRENYTSISEQMWRQLVDHNAQCNNCVW